MLRVVESGQKSVPDQTFHRPLGKATLIAQIFDGLDELFKGLSVPLESRVELEPGSERAHFCHLALELHKIKCNGKI